MIRITGLYIYWWCTTTMRVNESYLFCRYSFVLALTCGVISECSMRCRCVHAEVSVHKQKQNTIPIGTLFNVYKHTYKDFLLRCIACSSFFCLRSFTWPFDGIVYEYTNKSKLVMSVTTTPTRLVCCFGHSLSRHQFFFGIKIIHSTIFKFWPHCGSWSVDLLDSSEVS